MTLGAWIMIGAGWLVVAVAVAVVIGRGIHMRGEHERPRVSSDVAQDTNPRGVGRHLRDVTHDD